MATKVVDNFEYLAQKPLDGRSTVADLAGLVAMREYDIYDGIIVYVTAEQKYYTYDSKNSEDPTTKKWRELSTGGSGGGTWGSITGTLSNQTDLQSALDAKEDSVTAGTATQYYRGDKTWQTLDKSSVGLNNVDNTSDANKPISTATQTALDNKQDKLTAGTNITIDQNNVISSTGGATYTAGNGIDIDTNDEISVVPDDIISADVNNKLKLGQDGLLFAEGGDSGIASKGNIQGVRASVPSISCAANAWTTLKMSYLDGDQSMMNADGNFVAPEDGIYMFVIRPCDDGTGLNITQIVTVCKNGILDAAHCLAYEKSNTTTGQGVLTPSSVVKLNKGDFIETKIYLGSTKTIKNQSLDAPCEFYKISQNEESLVAEAAFNMPTSYTNAYTRITYRDTTDSSVIKTTGEIVLPEDGTFFLSVDALYNNVSNSGNDVYTLIQPGTTQNTVSSVAASIYPNRSSVTWGSVSAVISGKKGDVFTAWYHHTVKSSTTITYTSGQDKYKTRLFRMMATGGGGGGTGTTDYNDLENKPQINSVELDGNKSISDLDLISADSGNGLKIGSDGKLLAKGGDGILAEGNVRGVRVSVDSQTCGASSTWKTTTFSYLDGDETMFDKATNAFIAPVDGLYFIAARPFANVGLTVKHGVLVTKNKESQDYDSIVATSSKRESDISSLAITTNGIVKLKAGDKLWVKTLAASATNIGDPTGKMPTEFYLVSERSDGLVAQATYDPTQTSYPANTATRVRYANSSDTSIIANNGVITLPEDGYYLLSAELLYSTKSSTGHPIRFDINDLTRGIILYSDYWSSAGTLVNQGSQAVIFGKKGDQFDVKLTSSNYIMYNTVDPKYANAGVKLFKMSFSGSGGGGAGTTDYNDLTNKPQINNIELDGNKSISDLDLVSTDAGNSLEIGSDGKLLTKSGDGIMAEGIVRGVRALVPSTSVSANLWKALKMSYLDGDETMLNSDGNFVAPSDGIYMVSARPDDSATHSSIAHITSINKGTEYLPETTLAYAKSNTTTGSGILQASCVVKLKAGDVITVNFYAASAQTIKNQSTAMPCEFYLISERTDGLVAEAKYAAQNFAKDALQQVKLVDSTDTNVLSNDCLITLPEDGYYLFSSDNLNGTASTTNHAVASYLYETNTSGRLVGYHTVSAQTLAAPPINQVIAGKKGDQFLLAVRHSSYAYNFTRRPNDTKSGVKLFKMSFAGSGGGGTIDVDTEMSDTSENAVQNKVIKGYVDEYAGQIQSEYRAADNTLVLKGARDIAVELTEEHLTGETFNGKPVYERVFVDTIKSIGTLTAMSNSVIDNLDDVISIDIIVKHTNGGFYPASFRTSGQYTRAVYNKTSGLLYGEYGDNTFLNCPIKAVIKYTKK